MTDKQIIYKKECYNEPHCSLNQVLEQLKRKEQECEKLKEKYLNLKEQNGSSIVQLNTVNEQLDQLKVKLQDIMSNTITVVDTELIAYGAEALISLKEKLQAKEQECEKWKNAYEVKEDALEEAEEYTEELEEKLNQLKKENKELKRKNANKRTSLKKKQLHINQLKKENEGLKEKINSLLCSENCYKYKQAEKLKAELKETTIRKINYLNKNLFYKHKLEKIKTYCEEQNLKADWTACEVLKIIEE